MEDYEKNLLFRPTPRYDFAYLPTNRRSLYFPHRLHAAPPLPPPPPPAAYVDTILTPAPIVSPVGIRTYFKPPVLLPVVRPTDIYPFKPLIPRQMRPSNMLGGANIRKSNSLFTKTPASSYLNDGSFLFIYLSHNNFLLLLLLCVQSDSFDNDSLVLIFYFLIDFIYLFFFDYI